MSAHEPAGPPQERIPKREGRRHSHELVEQGRRLLAADDAGGAAESFRAALALAPDAIAAQLGLGAAMFTRGELGAAQAAFEKVLAQQPDHAAAHFNLGQLARRRSDLAAAIAHYRRSLAGQPRHVASLVNLGLTLFRERQFEEAVRLLLAALTIDPALRDVRACVGIALCSLGQSSRGIPYLEASFAENDADIELANGYALALAAGGKLETALDILRQALDRCPDAAAVHSNLLMLMHFSPECTPPVLYAQHLRWAAMHAAAIPRGLPDADCGDPERKLRIGLMTPHVVAGPVPAVLLPLLEHSDGRRLEFVLYANSAGEDATTARLRAGTAAWRRIDGATDDAFAAAVRSDRIDILFDLAGHSGGNRLPAFARRLAPIQVTWLDYFDTTGLDTVDYVLTDPVHTPDGSPQRFVERILRMPVTRLCFLPPAAAPPVAPTPALPRGYLTFGSFNRWAKTTAPVVALWAELLAVIPGARLLVKAQEFGDEGIRAAAQAHLMAQGIPGDRVELRGPSPYLAMLDEYADVDLALDTFPHNGGATTMDALWMGVPVLAHAGETMIARQSVALLTACGLEAFTAPGPDGLIAIARRWDADRAALAALRAGLRARVQASPLCDGPRFARDFEAVMRGVWRERCAGARAGSA